MSLPPTIFKTDQPEECNEFKKHLIKAMQDQATGYRVNAAIGHSKKHFDICNAKAESYDYVVLMLQAIEFKKE